MISALVGALDAELRLSQGAGRTNAIAFGGEMRGLLTAALVSVALALAPTTRAQPMTGPEYGATMQWAAGFQAILASVTTPFLHAPQQQQPSTPATRAAWLAASRQWMDQYVSTLQEARTRFAALGPVPQGPAAEMYQRQAALLPGMLDGLGTFIVDYRAALNAIERGDPQGARQALASSLGGEILICQLSSDTDRGQAEMMADGHPQKYLLQSFADSYDGFAAAIRLRRAALYGQPDNIQQTADLLALMSEHMLRDSVAGRAATNVFIARFRSAPTHTPAESDYRDRVIGAFNTYPASFDREEAIAGNLQRAADTLRNARSFEEGRAAFEQILSQAAVLDVQRGEDIRRRVAMVQNGPG